MGKFYLVHCKKVVSGDRDLIPCVCVGGGTSKINCASEIKPNSMNVVFV